MRGGSRPSRWWRTLALALVVLASVACSTEELSSFSTEGAPSEATWTAGAMDTERKGKSRRETGGKGANPETPSSDARTRSGSSGSAGVNDIGLIPFLLPTTEGEVYAADCEFSEDPYSACL